MKTPIDHGLFVLTRMRRVAFYFSLKDLFGLALKVVLPVHTEWIPELVQSLSLVPVPAVNDPPVGLHQHGRAKIPENKSSYSN